jgi:transcription termination factor NusB
MDSVTEFADLLAERTEEGLVRWRQDGVGLYSIEMGDNTILLSVLDEDEKTSEVSELAGRRISLAIFDDLLGRAVQKVVVSSIDKDYEVFRKLLRTAKKNARKLDPSLKSLVEDIQQLGR